MTQTKLLFTTSVNIIRDSNRDMNYIPTPNAVRIVNQISNDFKKGIRSFNIVGSYGTGKSSFLWALQQSLSGKKKIFNTNLLSNPKLDIINFVGEFKSLTSVFAEYFEVKGKQQVENIFSEIYNRYHDLGKKNPLMVIVIDEFGKFLEYAAQNSPEKELYFMQQLAEFVNNPEHNILLVTTIHQNFDAYAFSLNTAQKQEWTKVKGRFREITFNEPVEQLLHLAAEYISSNNGEIQTAKIKEVKKSLDIFLRTKSFNVNEEYVTRISEKLYPLDLLAANILTISLQKYGQNERSLFSFLESTDHTGIFDYDRSTNPFYNAACVYDYLLYNFYSFINSSFNPDFSAWSSIKSMLEETERAFDKDITNYTKIIKTIGLLNITAASGAILDEKFISNYAEVCLGISNAKELIKNLESKKIIFYRSYNKRFILFGSSDLDIQSALMEAGNKVSEITDVPTLIKKYYQLPPVIAKAHSYIKGTPRLFEYRISDYPVSEIAQGEIDGFVNLIFNEKLSLSDLKAASKKENEAILYGYYQNSKDIKNMLFEMEKTKRVIQEQEQAQDKIAVRELNNILIHWKNLLNHRILNNFYSKDVVWVFKGEEKQVKNKKQFNKLLSEICDNVYPKAPTFKNELVNRHKISSSIHTAKKFYLKALVDNWNQPDLGFDKEKFPPEKTIYITLLKENGLELYSDKINFTAKVSKGSTFTDLWNYSEEFLNSAKTSRRKISEFVELLGLRPFKLKQGLIDFWIPSFLFIKRDDYAMFDEHGGYIPTLSDEVLELVIKYPENYEIKTFDIEGVKLDIFNSYRVFLNQDAKEKLSNETFIETIKPFLTFYRSLPEYSKNTKRLSKEARAIRGSIVQSKDPEHTFFEAFPLALGYTVEELQSSKNKLQEYTKKLQEAIKELRTCYDGLVTRFEEFILNEFIGEDLLFAEYKEKLQSRYTKLRRHMLLPNQRVFIQRLDSALDDRKAWLNSIVQAVVGKTLDNFTDEDEVVLYDKFKTMILDLDSLTNISKADFSDDEEVFGLEISSFVEGVNKKLVRMPKNKKKEISTIQASIKKGLSKDTTLNIAALAGLLKELLKK
jgi:ABC-type dipeptide/oligopeptide/nickel transport system ATPase subunit